MKMIQGTEDIDEALTSAMHATLKALVVQNLLDKDIAAEFLAKHVCINADTSNVFYKFLSLFKFKSESSPIIVTVIV